jgi:hypothetical protein
MIGNICFPNKSVSGVVAVLVTHNTNIGDDGHIRKLFSASEKLYSGVV